MVSDFVDEHDGFLRLYSEQLTLARTSDTQFPSEARQLVEYGADKKGHWTSDKFMAQIERAVMIAEFTYNPAMHSVV